MKFESKKTSNKVQTPQQKVLTQEQMTAFINIFVQGGIVL